MALLLLFAAADPDAGRIGEITGQALAFLLFVAGIAKCVQIARRPTTSGWCAYGLALALFAWMTGSALVKIGGRLGTGRAAGAVLGLGLAAMSFLALVAIVVAVVGLVDLRKHPEYVQGRRQGVAAVVVSTIVLGLAMVGATRSVIAFLRTQGSAPAADADWTGKAETLTWADLNFTFDQPPRPYVKWDTTKSNPVVTVAFLRTRPSVYFMLIAERSSSASAMDSAGLASIARANLTSGAIGSPTFTPDRPQALGPATGLRFSATALVDKHQLVYDFWVYTRNGFLYQLITYGGEAQRDQIQRDADHLITRFHLIDPQRQAQATPARPFGEFRSEAFAYRLDLKDTAWTAWDRAIEENPEAEVGALLGDDAGLLITPFLLKGERVHPDALTQAALKSWSIEYPGPRITGLQRVREGGLEGYQFSHERTIDGTPYEYRMRLLADGHWGIFSSVWVVKGRGDVDALQKVLRARLRLGVPPSESRPERLPERMRQAHARLYNRIGLFYYNARDPRSGARFFEAAARLDESEGPYLKNWMRAASEAGERQVALAFLEEGKHAQKDDDEVRSWHAWFLKEEGRPEASLALYDQLFKGSYRGDDDFGAYAQLLAGAERWADLERAFDAYLAKEDSLKLRLQEARLLGSADRHQDAVRILEREQKQTPFSTDLAYQLIEHYRGLDQHRKVLEVCDALIANGFESASVLLQKGQAQMELKWYQPAKASFEAALKRKPGDRDIRDRLKEVSGLLGEGDNSAIKAVIPPVPLPPELGQRLADLAPPPDGASYGAYYAYVVDGFRFEKGRESVRTTRYRVKVIDQGGVERFSTLEVHFDPLSEGVYVNELTVRDGAGAVVARGRAADYYVTDRQGADEATHDQTLFVPVAGLQPGHAIDFTYTRRTQGAPAFYFQQVMLAAARPVGVRAVYYLGEPEGVRHRTAGPVKAERVQGGLLWSTQRPSVYVQEPMQPSAASFMPSVWISDAGRDWQVLAQDYLKLIAPKLASSAAVRSLATRLTRGLATREAKVEALVRHLQGDYVYKPIEFGRRALVPNTAAQTVQKRYGDCKDHAVLLQQLLEAAGIDAHLALVRTYDEVYRDLPSLDQFDHMIVYVPAAGTSPPLYYDTTDKSLAVRQMPPSGLGGREVLVLDPAAARFERVPGYAADSNRVRIEKQAQLGKDDGLSVSESVELTGYSAAAMRRRLKSLDPSQRKAWVQEELGAYARPLEIRSVTPRDLEDNDRPLALAFEYTLPHACTAEGNRKRCTLPATWERYYLEAEPVADRRNPFEILYPVELTSRTTFQPPAGRAAQPMPAATGKAEDAFAAWTASSTSSQGGLVVSFRAALKPGRFPAERYAAYRSLLDQGLRTIGGGVTVE